MENNNNKAKKALNKRILSTIFGIAALLIIIVAVIIPRIPLIFAVACTNTGNDITIAADCDFAAGTYTYTGTLTINSGVTVTTSGAVEIISDSIDVQGTITGDANGHAADTGPGATTASYSGAGYGGDGGKYTTYANGETYGSVTQPTDLGSGSTAFAGGGAIKLTTTGTLTIDGLVSADGENSTNLHGGGSGGSVWINAPSGTITGSGTITADGGAGASARGGGGGGRVAIYYTTDNSTWTTQTYGGDVPTTTAYTDGGAGSIYTKSAGATNGDLIVSNNNFTGIQYTTTQATTASQTYDNITISNGAKYIIPNTHTLTLASSGTLTSGGTLQPSLTIDSGGTFNTPSTTYTFDDIDIVNNGTMGVVTALTVGGTNTTNFTHNSSASFGATLSSLTVDNLGTFSQSGTGTISIPTITVQSGGNLTHTDNSTAKNNILNISSTNIDIQSGGSVNVDNIGFDQDQGPGSTTASYSGAGYGGDGGKYTTYANGGTYGSVTQPTDLGSGSTAFAGGGAIKLTASGTLTVNGDISAKGQDSTSTHGGGSGGSVWINAPSGTITGSGTITADGGAGASARGGGGGGRVAIYYTTDNSTWTTQTYGGDVPTTTAYTDGGAGSIYTKSAGATNGDLIVSNNNFTGIQYTTTQATTASQTYDNITIKNGAKYIIPNTHTLTLASGGTLTSGGTLQPSLTIDSGGTFNTPSTTYTFDDIDIVNNGTMGVVTALTVGGTNTTNFTHNSSASFGATLSSLTVDNLGTFSQSGTGTISIPTITVQGGGNLTHTTNTTAKSNILDISATNIDIQSGGTVNADYIGYTSGSSSPGWGGTYDGAGYGGDGGDNTASGDGTGGATYGSVTQPTDLGSDTNYADGGGAIKLTASGTITIDGTISTNGQNSTSTSYGGAAGGSIWINTPSGTVTGSGTITANGGNPNSTTRGAGGGGRIAIYYTIDASDFVDTGTIEAFGGSTGSSYQDGGAGSIYIKEVSATNGDVFYDNGTTNTGYLAYSTQVTDSSQTYDNITIKNGAKYKIPNTFTLALTSGGTLTGGGTSTPELTIDAGGTLTLPSANILNSLTINNNGTFNLSGSMNVTNSTFAYDGSITGGLTNLTIGNGGVFRHISTSPLYTGSSLTIENGGTYIQENTTTISVGTLTIDTGGTLTHLDNSTTKAAVVDFSVTDALINGDINVDYKGFDSTTGTGEGGDAAAGGGAGYGGVGGPGYVSDTSQTNGGTVYGTTNGPDDIGSGGGDDTNIAEQQGGSGGGAIKILASGTITVNGSITAKGQDGTANEGGGGSGGSIWLEPSIWAGSGSMIVNGGLGSGTNSTGGGCGGGGLQYIYYSSKTFSGATSADPGCTGVRAGATGTVTELTGSAPSISSIVPTEGSTLGLTSVVINGSNFSNYPSDPTVTFGGTSGTNITFINSNQLTVTSPSHSAGTVDIVVTNPDAQFATSAGSGWPTTGFKYNTPPVLTSTSPTTGINDNTGITVTFNGSNFLTGITAKLTKSGETDISCTGGTYVETGLPTSFDCDFNIDGAEADDWTVVVENTDTQTDTLVDYFSITNPPPTVTNINPAEGATAGGTNITITGTNFISDGITRTINITNSGGILTNHQITFDLDTAALISASKMQNDCDDLRVYDTDGTTTLPYWIEDGTCNSSTTKIWTKIPTIDATSDTIKITYGFSALTNNENGDNVFEFFDDFSGASVDLTKWEEDTTQFSVGGGILENTNTNSYRLSSIQAFTGNYVQETKHITQTGGTPANGYMINGFFAATSNGIGYLNQSTLDYYREDTGFINIGTGTIPNNVQIRAKVEATSSTNVTISLENYDTEASLHTATDTDNGLSNEKIALGKRYDNALYNQAYDGAWDWIFVRNYSSNTIAATPGTETSTLPTVTFDIGGTPAVATNVVYVSDTSLTATTSAHAAGLVDATVTNYDTASGTLTNGFEYFPPPTIASLSTTSGHSEESSINIPFNGTGFRTGVTGRLSKNGTDINGTSCTFTNSTLFDCNFDLTSVTNDELGDWDATAINSDTQTDTLSEGFEITHPPPTLTLINPNIGTEPGGTSITITGTNFYQDFSTPITITYTGSTLTNHQVLFTLDTATLIAAGKMSSSCNDIRVYDSNQTTALNFWIEDNTCNTATTNIWAKIPSIASGGKTIYTTYGDPGLTSQSNGDNVFEFFDDFNGGTLDTTKWPTTQNLEGDEVSGGYLTLQGAEGLFAGNNVIAGNTVWESKVTRSNTSNYGTPLRAATTTTTGWVLNGGANLVDIMWYNSILYGETHNSEISMGAWTTGTKRYEITYRPSDYAANTALFDYDDGTSTATRTTANAADTLYPTIYLYNTASDTPQWDYWFIRKYAESGPTTGVGSETSNALDVTFDGTSSATLVFDSTTQLTVTNPAHATGAVNVAVINPDTKTATSVGGYTYGTPPTITGILPVNGPEIGGFSVTVSGTGFTSGATVHFENNSYECTNYNYTSIPTDITCNTPVHADGGPFDIIITNPSTLNNTLTTAYTFNPRPAVTDISPTNGTTGNSLVINGSDFIATPDITVGGTACTIVTWVSATQLTCTLPTKTTGTYDVIVTNPDTQTDTVAHQTFTYNPAPTVTNTVPGNGTAAGGTTVTLTGTGFLNDPSDPTVTIGGTTCTSVNYIDSTSLTCSTGSHAAATVDTIITNHDGQIGTQTNGYTYNPAPVITSIVKDNGTSLGGSTITINGQNFIATPTVDFGGSTCTPTFINSTQITCITSAHSEGYVDVTLTNPDSQSDVTINGFRYTDDPEITSITPATGPINTANTVTIYGYNFVNNPSDPTVTFGGETVTVVWVSDQELTITTPLHSTSEIVQVIVTLHDGRTDTIGGYSYTTVSPLGWTATPSTNCPTQGAGATMIEVNNLIYILPGGSTTAFYKYDPTSGVETCNSTPLANFPETISNNVTLEEIDSDTIFAIHNSKAYQYDISADTWISVFEQSKLDSNTSLNQSGATQGLGNTIVKYNDEIYVLAGGGTTFEKYNPAANTWTTLDPLPAAAGSGAALTTMGTNIYALRGDGTNEFYIYNISGDSWTASTITPATVNAGGSLTNDGTYIYALRGGLKRDFWRYSGGSWSSMAYTPTFVYGGGALTYNGSDIYAFQGNNSRAFWKYTIAGNTWTTLDNISGLNNVSGEIQSGGALTSDGTNIYAIRGANDKQFYKYTVGTSTWSQLDDLHDAVGSASNTEARGGIAYWNDVGINSSIFVSTGNGVTGKTTTSLSLLWRYPLTGGSYTNTWPSYPPIPTTPETMTYGASLAYHSGFGDILYILRGGATQDFWKYSFSSNEFIPWDRPLLQDDTTIFEQDTPVDMTLGPGSQMVEIGGEFYMTRGNDTTTFVKYNPTKNKWTQLANTPFYASNNIDENITMSKGTDGNTILLLHYYVVAEYNITTDSWILHFPLATTDSGEYYSQDGTNQNTGNSIEEVDGKLYSISGASTTFQQFDPITNTWITLTSNPGTFTYGASMTRVENDIYIFRGSSTDFYSYNTLNDTWTTLNSITGNTGAGAALHYPGTGEFIYAFRGSNNNNEFWRYCIPGSGACAGPVAEGAWDNSLATTPTFTYGGADITSIGSYLYAIGGNNTTDFWKYDIVGDSWDNTTPTDIIRGTKSGAAFAVDDKGTAGTTDDIIYLTVGGDSKTVLKYYPQYNSWRYAAFTPNNIGWNAVNQDNGDLVFSSTLNNDGTGYFYASTGHGDNGLNFHIDTDDQGQIYRFIPDPETCTSAGINTPEPFDPDPSKSGTNRSYPCPGTDANGNTYNTWPHHKLIGKAPTGVNSAAHESSMVYPGTDDLVYALLGSPTSDNFYAFDNNIDEWNAFPKSIIDIGGNLETVRQKEYGGNENAGITILNDEIYYIGVTGSSIGTDNLYTPFSKYDPSTNKWTRLADIPVNSDSGSPNRMIIADPRTGYENEMFIMFDDKMWKYNTTDNFHTELNGLHTGQIGSTHKVVYPGAGNWLYIMSGESGPQKNDIWRYNMVYDIWIISSQSYVDTFGSDVIDQDTGAYDSQTVNTLVAVSTDIYQVIVESQLFRKYDFVANSWSALESFPGSSPSYGMDITYDEEQALYYTPSYNYSQFYKYCLSPSTACGADTGNPGEWETLTSAPYKIGPLVSIKGDHEYLYALRTGDTTTNSNTFLRYNLFKEARLNGGTSATSFPATWASITNGEFAITLNGGTSTSVTGCNFTGDTTMDEVAESIQTCLRTATSSSELVQWDTDHFKIISADPNPTTSNITVLNTTGGGTDISGVTAGNHNYMDAEVAVGTIVLDTNQPKVLNGGTSTNETYSSWTGITDGSFTISLNGGAPTSVTGCNFTGDTSMYDVADSIQTCLRTATSGTETVTYIYEDYTNRHFIIKSDDTDPATSDISVLGSTGTGTDISGAGSDYMDADIGAADETISYGNWETLSPLPDDVSSNASLSAWTDGNTIYATVGDHAQTFWSYSISGDSWTNESTTDPIPDTIGWVSTLLNDGTYFYLPRGGNTQELYKYDPAASAGTRWSTLADTPIAFGSNYGDATYMAATDDIWVAPSGSTGYDGPGSSRKITALLFRYDVAANEWPHYAQTATEWDLYRYFGIASNSLDDFLYILGGSPGADQNFRWYNIQSKTGDTTNDRSVQNPGEGSWGYMPEYPIYIDGPLLASYGEDFYAIRGTDEPEILYFDDQATHNARLTTANFNTGTENGPSWKPIENGNLVITVDGTLYNIFGVDFTSLDPVTSTMRDVATIMETALRNATGGTENIYWCTDYGLNTKTGYFIFESSTTPNNGGSISATTDNTVDGAKLTGNNSATNNPATWAAISNGSFRIDSDAYGPLNITSCDFTGDTTMDQVAADIRTCWIAANGGSWESVTWNTNHFIFEAASTVLGTADISVTSAATPATGTDISVMMDTNTGTITPVEVRLNNWWTGIETSRTIEGTRTNGTPARLLSGASTENTPATWAAITDGSFRISLEGATATSVTTCNFTGDTTMANVASSIQSCLQTATSGTETVTWNTDHFVITDPTSLSSISVLSSGLAGTDISGVASGTQYMDADTGNGTVITEGQGDWIYCDDPQIDTLYSTDREKLPTPMPVDIGGTNSGSTSGDIAQVYDPDGTPNNGDEELWIAHGDGDSLNPRNGQALLYRYLIDSYDCDGTGENPGTGSNPCNGRNIWPNRSTPNAPTLLIDHSSMAAYDNATPGDTTDDSIFATGGGTTFWKYTIDTDSSTIGEQGSWDTTLTQHPNGFGTGAQMAYDGTDNIFVAEGQNLTDFWKYNITGNTWTSAATIPTTVGSSTATDKRGSLLLYNGDLWLTPGNTSNEVTGTNKGLIYRYDLGTSSWPVIYDPADNTSATSGFSGGSDLTAYDASNLYALQGSSSTTNPNFWHFNPTSGNRGLWTQKADMPTINPSPNPIADVQAGGSLEPDTTNGFIYGFRGDGSTDFFRYKIASDAWKYITEQALPVSVGSSSTTTDAGELTLADSLFGISGSGSTIYRLNDSDRLVITDINAGVDPYINTDFTIEATIIDSLGVPVTPASVTTTVNFTFTVETGTGSIAAGTTTGTIGIGTNNTTVTGVQYDTAETGIELRVTDDATIITSTVSDPFDVVNPPPTITSITPNNGSESGGTSVTIAGTNFYGTPTITFDGNSATSIVLVNSSTLTADTPAGTGDIDVIVTNPDTQSVTSLGTGWPTTGFRYLGAPNATTSTFTSNPASVVANGVTTSLLTATVKDSSSNPLGGEAVTVLKSAGTGTPTIKAVNCAQANVGTITKGTTNSSGQACFTVQSTTVTTPGNDTFQATITSGPTTITQTPTVEFTIDHPDQNKSTFSGVPSSVTADGVTTSTLTATITDSLSRVISGETIDVDDDQTPGDITYNPPGKSEATNTSGIADFDITSTIANTYTFTANLNTTYYDTNNYTETASTSTFINDYAGTASTLISGSQGDNVEATITLPFDFRLYDQNITSGNSLYVCSNGFISLASTGCPASGSLTNTIAGFFTDLDTTSGGIYREVASDSNSVTLLWDAVEQGTANSVMFEIILYRNNRIDFHYFATAPATITSPRIGLYNNTGGASPTKASTFNSAAVTTKASTKFENTETTGAIDLTQTDQVEFTAGTVDATNSTIIALPSSVEADGTTTSTITVTLKDSFNNPIPSRTVEVTDDVSSGQITYLTSGAPHTEDNTDVNGEAVFTVSSSIPALVTFEGFDKLTSTSIGTDTVDFTCIINSNQQCVQIEIDPSAGVLTITSPDDFAFPAISSAPSQQEKFSINSTTPYTLNTNDIVTVTDTQMDGGFTLQLQSSPFTDGSNTLPATGFYAVTQAASTGGTQNNGIEYPSGYAGIMGITSPQNNTTAGSLSTASTFTINGDNLDSIIDIMQGSVTILEGGRNGTFKQNVQYYIIIPAAQAIGGYSTTLTFDLTRTPPT